MAAGPAAEHVWGLGSSAVAVGGFKWTGITMLGIHLYNAPSFVKRVLVIGSVKQQGLWGLVSSAVAEGAGKW